VTLIRFEDKKTVGSTSKTHLVGKKFDTKSVHIYVIVDGCPVMRNLVNADVQKVCKRVVCQYA
jgi:hypothetical protein